MEYYIESDEEKSGEMDSLCDDITTICLQNEDNSEYILDNDLEMRKEIKVAEIEMTFFQAWCLFGMPKRDQNRLYYEYCISGPYCNFVLRSFDKKFLGVRNWNVVSESVIREENNEFIKHLQSGLDCYNKYYKSIESNVYRSEYSSVRKVMREIHKNLMINRDILRTL